MLDYPQALRRILEHTADAITSISSQNFKYKDSPHKWSKKQLLGHLIDSAYNNHQRFLRATTQTNFIFQGYDQDQWVLQNNYQNRTKEEVINTWITVNQHLSILIEGLPIKLLTKETTEHNFHKICMNRPKEGESISLAYLIWDYLFHLEHHLAQILPNYIKTIPLKNGDSI